MSAFRTVPALFPLVAAGLLAGCGGHDDKAADNGTTSIRFSGIGDNGADGNAQTVAVSVPGFSAKLNLPGVDLAGGSTGIDGIAMHPGSKITGLNVTGKAGDGTGGESHGTVEMAFADPGAAPDALLAYYRDAAKRGGWTEVPPAAGQQFAATKAKDGGNEQLALQIAAAGSGSSGRFVVNGQ